MTLSGYAALLIGALVCRAWPHMPGPVQRAADELYQQQMNDELADAAAQRKILEAKAPASWTAEDFEPYLIAATNAIEMAILLFDLHHGAFPGSIEHPRRIGLLETLNIFAVKQRSGHSRDGTACCQWSKLDVENLRPSNWYNCGGQVKH